VSLTAPFHLHDAAIGAFFCAYTYDVIGALWLSLNRQARPGHTYIQGERKKHHTHDYGHTTHADIHRQ
jgi:hypothetical protein